MARHTFTSSLVIALSLIGAACTSNSTGQATSTSTSSPGNVGNSTTSTLESSADTTTTVGTIKIELIEVATVDEPVALSARSGTEDLYVAEKSGLVRLLKHQGDGTFKVDRTPVVDLHDQVSAGGEQGLLGITFSPDGTKMYLDFTDQAGDTRVVEYSMNEHRADPESARELLFVKQPDTNHNGGHLTFGPDGYLYIGLGDGGVGYERNRTSQDTEDLLGKILRIDPSSPSDGQPYGIPPDNPFSDGTSGRPEVWLLGARNPWRFSFDSENGDLWVADVGQDQWEEINWLPAQSGDAGRGANLGWSLFEGHHAYDGEDGEGGEDDTGLVTPVYEYSHDDGGCSVIGGFVYRGSDVPALVGSYIFGDYCLAKIMAVRPTDASTVTVVPLGVAVADNSLSSFGVDNSGEIYVLSTEGAIYRISEA